MRAWVGLASLPLMLCLVGCPAAKSPSTTLPGTDGQGTSKETANNDQGPPDDPATIELLKKLGAKVSLNDAGQVIGVDLSEESLDKVEEADQIADALAGLKKLRKLQAYGPELRDSQVAKLSGLSELRELELINTNLSDAGIEHLSRLIKLETLYLRRANITDLGLEQLAPLQNLQRLDLRFTNVTSAGMKSVARKGSRRFGRSR